MPVSRCVIPAQVRRLQSQASVWAVAHLPLEERVEESPGWWWEL